MGIEIMDKNRKRNLGIWSFIPLILFAIAGIYHISTFSNEVAAQGANDHVTMVSETDDNFGMLTMLYGIAAAFSLGMLIYYIIHLLRIKNMSIGAKGVWAVVLAALVPVSFIAFWYWFILKEPEKVEVNDNIT